MPGEGLEPPGVDTHPQKRMRLPFRHPGKLAWLQKYRISLLLALLHAHLNRCKQAFSMMDCLPGCFAARHDKAAPIQ